MRELIYLGSSLKDLSRLPEDVQSLFEFALAIAVDGGKHEQAEPLQGFHGAGVLEVVEDYDTNTYPAVYTVKFKSAIYVLHVFQKKSRHGIELPREDTKLITKRLADARTIEQGRNRT